MSRLISLSGVAAVLATPLMVAVGQRARQKGGWAMILYCRCYLARAAVTDDLTVEQTDRIMRKADAYLDLYGEPPHAFALATLGQFEQTYRQDHKIEHVEAVGAVRRRFYRGPIVT